MEVGAGSGSGGRISDVGSLEKLSLPRPQFKNLASQSLEEPPDPYSCRTMSDSQLTLFSTQAFNEQQAPILSAMRAEEEKEVPSPEFDKICADLKGCITPADSPAAKGVDCSGVGHSGVSNNNGCPQRGKRSSRRLMEVFHRVFKRKTKAD